MQVKNISQDSRRSNKRLKSSVLSRRLKAITFTLKACVHNQSEFGLFQYSSSAVNNLLEYASSELFCQFDLYAMNEAVDGVPCCSCPSHTHSFIPGLKPSFSANPSLCSPSFFFYLNIHYVDSPDCLLLFLSISVFYFQFFSLCFYTLQLSVPYGRLS